MAFTTAALPASRTGRPSSIRPLTNVPVFGVGRPAHHYSYGAVVVVECSRTLPSLVCVVVLVVVLWAGGSEGSTCAGVSVVVL
jgi:hypothetical protein